MSYRLLTPHGSSHFRRNIESVDCDLTECDKQVAIIDASYTKTHGSIPSAKVADPHRCGSGDKDRIV